MNSLTFLETLHGLEVKFINLFFKNIPMPQAAHSLNDTSARCLLMLYYEKQLPMSKAAEHLHLEKGSFTSVAKKLQTSQLIERVALAEDRRVHLLRLTDRGTTLAKLILQSYTDHIEEVFQRLPQRQQKDLATTVNQLHQILQDALDSEGKTLIQETD